MGRVDMRPDLMPLAHRISPRATLLGVRGARQRRAMHDGFDVGLQSNSISRISILKQRHLMRSGAKRARPMVSMPQKRPYSVCRTGPILRRPSRRFYPGDFQRAILNRPMLVLDAPETVDLSELVVPDAHGERRSVCAAGAALNEWLRRCGARLEAHAVAAGHGLVPDDLALARAWAASRRSV